MRKLIISAMIAILLCIGLFVIAFTIPIQSERRYGPPASRLTFSQRVKYSARLLWYDGLLTRPMNPLGSDQDFSIEVGESVNSIAQHLQSAGLIRDAAAFRDYLIYTGLDTSIQSGNYQLNPNMSAVEIAHRLQDATSQDVTFVILPGWRLEEIAASLPTSGLPITPDQFLTLTHSPRTDYDFLVGASSLEGFLFPDSYVFPRTLSADELISTFIRNFNQRLLPEVVDGFTKQGLTVYQAVTLASIVEREAVKDEEKPIIASVYLNRLRIPMKLDADPTVQYALGYDQADQTWWKSPLGLDDLQMDSVYNTYIHEGLPPAPIANPSLTSLRAVAFPSQTDFYFFRAKCDGSGYHTFSQTFEEHVANGCP